jgi:hypothetical protein
MFASMPLIKAAALPKAYWHAFAAKRACLARRRRKSI